MSDLKNNLITNEVIEYFWSLIPSKYHNQKLVIDEEKSLVFLETIDKTFFLKIGKDNDRQLYVKIGNSIILYNSDVKNISKRNVKTKKSKVSLGKKILLKGAISFFTVVSIISFVAIKSLNTKEKIKETTSSYERQVDESIPHVTLAIEPEESIEMPSATLENIVNLQVSVNPIDSLGAQKRNRTVSLYGDKIAYYTEKYGMPYEFMVDLLSQERHNDYDDVSENNKNNIGQLTKALCTEPIVTPVFTNDEITSYEGFFILPSTYPNNEDTSSLESINLNYLNEMEQSNLKKAIFLQNSKNVLWKVYRKEDAFYKPDVNVQISIAYLSYLVNMKNDFIKGVMSYHAGYVKVKNDLTREEIVSGEVLASDANYIKNVLRYEPIENYNNGFFFEVHYENKETEIYKITNPVLEMEGSREEKNEYHL